MEATSYRVLKRVLLGILALAMVAVATGAIYARVNPVWGEWRGSELTPWLGTSSAVEGVALDFSIGGTVQGSDGCGWFTADYSADDNVLRVTNEASTANGCADERGALSTRIWDIILGNPTITRDGKILVLESPAGKLTLRKD